jgi:hypothetical protein
VLYARGLNIISFSMDVLVFATGVQNPAGVSKVKPLLSAIPAITQWTFDLEDCDHILRIVASNLNPRKVESLLQTAGFNCYELEY